MVGPPGIEPGLPPCEGDVLPLDYGPFKILIYNKTFKQQNILITGLIMWYPVFLALLAGLATALGALIAFAFKPTKKFISLSIGFTGGVMITLAFAGLLPEAMEISFLSAIVGFSAGALFLLLLDNLLPHMKFSVLEKGVIDKRMFKTAMLIAIGITLHNMPEGFAVAAGYSYLPSFGLFVAIAIALHNIPEGLAVGVAFGALAGNADTAALGGAIALAFGIGLQNFPEGAAVSIPLRREGFSRLKGFWYGQLSGIVEPIAGVLGAYLVLVMKPLLPYALSFAAGAMIFVVVEELIPESQLEKHTDVATIGAMMGFAVMMTLDVALG